MLDDYVKFVSNKWIQRFKYIWFLLLLFFTFTLIYSSDIHLKYGFDISFISVYLFIITGVSLVYIILESVIVSYVNRNNLKTNYNLNNDRLILLGFFVMFYFLFF